MGLLVLCAYWCYVPIGAIGLLVLYVLVLCAYWFYGLIGAMGLLLLCAYWCYVPPGATGLLVLCAYWCCGPTGAMCLLLLWAYWCYRPTGAMCLLVTVRFSWKLVMQTEPKYGNKNASEKYSNFNYTKSFYLQGENYRACDPVRWWFQKVPEINNRGQTEVLPAETVWNFKSMIRCWMIMVSILCLTTKNMFLVAWTDKYPHVPTSVFHTAESSHLGCSRYTSGQRVFGLLEEYAIENPESCKSWNLCRLFYGKFL